MSGAPPHRPTVRVYGARPHAGPGDANPVLAGVIVGVLVAVVWMLLVYVVHNPVSLGGWGAGGVIGLTLAKAGRASSRALGTVAAVLTVGTVVLAKALILAFALGPIVFPMLGRLFSLWDLLWLGLGVSSAWKLAQSGAALGHCPEVGLSGFACSRSSRSGSSRARLTRSWRSRRAASSLTS